ncbi:major facilitator superfamily MFS_1 [Coriobacterium glomerans PW2]|uniref:Major facilitator superfamily MFS_1 n=1 Tax=Coriobacterium glomerans (strain ATCC 49209 / DSM 20642 / JCM 10262 / PW2) TaxID=700015 RepID=F2N8W5_CORGP|nr:MFS transporter [Coriobacterium glomerans]AEB07565.1 major facilitator superfamily MFS_1 [Coriobacterium glomerans PW2]
MERRLQQTFIFKVSLLSISLFLSMAPQISSALPLMYGAFPGIDQAGVETLATIPNFGIMAGLLISPQLARLIGKKLTIVLGLVIGLIAGTVPMATDSYILILITRFLLGAGIGLFNSLAVSLIPQFYLEDKNELATMIGYQNVMGGVGAALASLLVSHLVVISWHAAFGIYLLFIPSLVAFTMFVPLKSHARHPDEDASRPGDFEKHPRRINASVIEIAVLMFLIFVFFMPMSFRLPNLVVSEGIGTASQIALVGAGTTLVGIPVGMAYGFLFKHLREVLFPLGFGLTTLGFLAVATAPDLAFLIVAVLVVGVGFGLAVPYVYTWLDQVAPQESINFATTVILVLVNLGCFVSPMLISAISSFIGIRGPRAEMLISVVAFAAMFIYAVKHVVNARATRERERKERTQISVQR